MKQKNKAKKQKAHLIGICGAGMSALAVLLKESGYEISGSDSGSYEPILSYLKKNKISFFKKYSAKNIPKRANLIIIGKHSELTKKNPEVRESFRSGKKVMSLPEVLAILSREKKNIIVAGSFGKSTTTALISFALQKSGKNPSYFIGAVPINSSKSSHLGGGKDFVLEGDEYPSSNWDKQSKFLHLSPFSVLLISTEHDHVNIFPTHASYKAPYRKLMAKIPAEGLLVYSYEDKGAREVAKYAKCKKVSYSLHNKKSNWYTKNIKYGAETSFDLMRKNKKIAQITTPLLGNHNIENIVGAGAMLLEEKKITPRDFTKAVKIFRGLKRRLELLNPGSAIPVYEGFGSSYEKTRSVFDALRLHFPKKRIVTIFEPQTFSWRNKGAKKWYKNIFDTSERVVILPPSKHGKKTHDQMSFSQIIQEVKKNHNEVYRASNEKEALSLLKKLTKKNDIIVLVSSGSLLGLSTSVPKLMEKLFPR
ncbi:MAG: Mur ligase family protein [Candidatus Paceibacterota bacterium]